MSASNYPPGLSDSTVGAPWSEPMVPDMDFEVTCSQSLSKTVTVTTNNYIPGASGVDYDPDTSDTNWGEEYHENDYHTPIQLIELLGKVLQENMKHGIVFRNPKFTEHLISECKDWTEDETEYMEN